AALGFATEAGAPDGLAAPGEDAGGAAVPPHPARSMPDSSARAGKEVNFMQLPLILVLTLSFECIMRFASNPRSVKSLFRAAGAWQSTKALPDSSHERCAAPSYRAKNDVVMVITCFFLVIGRPP